MLVGLLQEWLQRRRDAQVRFLREENRILRSRLDQQRLILAPEERVRLLAIGAELRHQVKDLITVVQFRTYQRWIREQQGGRKPGRVGRPRKIGPQLRQLIVRLAKENPGWGYLRIVGELLKLRCSVGKTSVRRILLEEGINPRPQPDRSGRHDFQPWDEFLRLHLNTLVACDFFCKSIWTPLGKRQAYFLAFIHVGSRRVWVSSSTYHPNEAWVLQQGRNLLMWLEETGLEATHLIHDRDTKFTDALDALFKNSAGIDKVQTPVRPPNANAYAESWIATIKRECLDYFACFSFRHVDHVVQAFVGFYNDHRPHQSFGNRTLDLADQPPSRLVQTSVSPTNVGCRSDLGGLLKHYCRRAA
ncbi:MAG: integrase core domain-containing protein [Planctomycetota bacterium]